MGRQLKSISGNGKEISYKYNDSGIRTEKTVNGVTRKYYLSGSSVKLEENRIGKIYYNYAGFGNLISMNLNEVFALLAVLAIVSITKVIFCVLAVVCIAIVI